MMSKGEIQQSNSMVASFMGATLDYWEARNRAEACNQEELENGDTIWIDQDGFEVQDASYWNFEEVPDEYLPPLEDYSDWNVPEEELQYHCSYDWLIPVVQKINDSTTHKITIELYEKNKVKTYYLYTGSNRREWSQIKDYPFTIEGVYQAVCETIKLIKNG